MGEDGILANARDGLAYFDLSTNSLSLAKRLHSKFAEAGAAMLDAPVSGGPEGAANGDLVIWAGDKDVFDRHLDVLTILAKSPLHVGDAGAGTVTKLAHNLLGYMILESLAEAFTLGTKAGVDPLDLWEAMRLGLAVRATRFPSEARAQGRHVGNLAGQGTRCADAGCWHCLGGDDRGSRPRFRRLRF